MDKINTAWRRRRGGGGGRREGGGGKGGRGLLEDSGMTILIAIIAPLAA